MDHYVQKLRNTLGPDNPCTIGFDQINKIIKEDSSASSGIFYTGKQMVVYFSSDEEFFASPVSRKGTLVERLKEAVFKTCALHSRIKNTIKIFPFDEIALQDLESKFNGAPMRIGGKMIEYSRLPLVRGPDFVPVVYEDLAGFVGIYACEPEKQKIRDKELKYLREAIIVRYTAEPEELAPSEPPIMASEKA